MPAMAKSIVRRVAATTAPASPNDALMRDALGFGAAIAAIWPRPHASYFAADRLERAPRSQTLFAWLAKKMGLTRLASPPVPAMDWLGPILNFRDIERDSLEGPELPPRPHPLDAPRRGGLLRGSRRSTRRGRTAGRSQRLAGGQDPRPRQGRCVEGAAQEGVATPRNPTAPSLIAAGRRPWRWTSLPRPAGGPARTACPGRIGSA